MKQLLALILATSILYSCEPDSSEIGADFFTNGALDFSYIDSSTVNLSTIQLEEIATNTASRMLVGTHQDENLGRITASPYFQITPTESINFKDQNVAYDYLSLLLPMDHYYYYDTLSALTLNVYRVTEDIKTENGYLYNSSSFQMEKESLGSITFKPKPHHDSVEIKLSDVLGKEIFQKALTASSELNPANFLKYIRGFVVVPDTTSSACILGLTTIPTLKLHYIDKSNELAVKKYAAFNVNSTANLYFTNITCDRAHTELETLPDEKGRLSSNETGGKAYLQAGALLSFRVDIPYLRDLKQLENFYPTRAVLEIYPVRKTFDPHQKLPAELIVFKVDKRNVIYEEFETTANLVEDIDLGRETHYSFDATQFVKAQMELQSLNENALIFTIDTNTYPVSADRVYASAASYEYKTRLRIYFATINN
jgi:hypothetical protein